MANYLIEKGTNYSYLLDNLKNPSFESIRKLSVNFVNQLSEEVQTELWEALSNGVEVLESEALLSMYMYAYGKMHAAKLQAAFEHLPAEKLEDIHLIDWGCGQAMATVIYHEYLKENAISSNVKTITLIEPSELALKRATLHARKLFPNAEIKTVKKDFDKLTADDIQMADNQTILHFLSNVLDIEYFSIEHLAGLIEQNKACNLLACVSPYINEFKNQRLYNFISCFQNASTIADYVSKEWHCGWTIDYKVVEVNLAVKPDNNNSETFTDIDGNVYKTVKIGNQIWMAENLRVSRFRNGELISNNQLRITWDKIEYPNWLIYDNDVINDIKYGKLYNWPAVIDERNLAPEGWHIPNADDWKELDEFIYNNKLYDKNDYKILSKNFNDLQLPYPLHNAKSLASSEDWLDRNDIGAVGNDLSKNNSSGFSALPSGSFDGKYNGLGCNAGWWSLTNHSMSNIFLIGNGWTSLKQFQEQFCDYTTKNKHLSVRCIKDEEVDTFEIVWENRFCGFRNSKGEMITDYKYDNAYKFKDGLACVFINKKYGYINKKGEVVIPIIYDVTEYFMGSHDYNFHCGLTEVKQNNKYGFVDKNGVVRIPIVYESVGYFNENLVSVSINYKYGYLNNFGEIVVQLIYDFATNFKDGFGEVSLGGKYGFVNKMGELIIPCKFENVKCFSEGYAAVRLNNKFGFIDTEGNSMIPYIFNNPYDGSFYKYDNTK